MIKRFLTLILSIVTCWPCSSATDVATLLPDRSIFILPAEISKDGKAFVYTYQRNEQTTKTVRFNIYDEDFQMVKDFVTKPGTPDNYSILTQEREMVPVYATVDNVYKVSHEALVINGISEGLTIETVLNELNGSHILDSDWVITSLEDGTQVVAISSEFYREEYFGHKYPQFVYKQENGLWFYFRIDYTTVSGPYGEWEAAVEHQSDGSYPSLIYVTLLPLDGSDEQSFLLTRGIFSDDCCYVLPEYRTVEVNNVYNYPTYDNTEWIYKKEWGYRSEIRALKAFDSSNNEVACFEIPEGYKTSSSEVGLEFLRLNDKRYILMEIMKPGSSEYGYDYFTAIYRLDEGNKVTQVAIAPTTKIAPRAPRQGELVTITFDENTISSPKTINVVSASGQNVYKTKLPAGQSSIDLDTSRLNQGMYIVTVSVDGRSQEAAKIIVR